jgi:hypothetical protein
MKTKTKVRGTMALLLLFLFLLLSLSVAACFYLAPGNRKEGEDPAVARFFPQPLRNWIVAKWTILENQQSQRQSEEFHEKIRKEQKVRARGSWEMERRMAPQRRKEEEQVRVRREMVIRQLREEQERERQRTHQTQGTPKKETKGE